jgi:hypothetical protein
MSSKDRGTRNHSEVPRPAGALHVAGWLLEGGTARSFRGTRRGTADDPAGRSICVDIDGDQYIDGTTDRWISMNVNACLDSANARDLAAHLLAAADEVDELTRSEIRRWDVDAPSADR